MSRLRVLRPARIFKEESLHGIWNDSVKQAAACLPPKPVLHHRGEHPYHQLTLNEYLIAHMYSMHAERRKLFASPSIRLET